MPYIVSIWYQPAANFSPCKAMGVNAVVGIPVDMAWPAPQIDATVSQWAQATVASGLSFVIQSGLLGAAGNVSSFSNCIGVILDPDECNGGGPDKPLRTPAQMAAIAAAARRLTNKPLWLDLDGAALAYQPDDATLKGYLDCCDVVSSDYYYFNRGGDRAQNQNAINIDRIRRLAPGKRIFGVPEVNDQGLRYSGYFPNGRGPTGKELAGILAELDQHKADGVILFADVFGITGNGQYGWLSFGVDAIPPENKMVLQQFAAAKNPPPAAPVPAPAGRTFDASVSVAASGVITITPKP